MNRLKSILVGVDFFECSKAPLQQAARMAKWNGASLLVLHVIESMVVTQLAEALKVPVEQQRQTVLTGARHELTRWLGNTDSRGMFKTDIVIGILLDEIPQAHPRGGRRPGGARRARGQRGQARCGYAGHESSSQSPGQGFAGGRNTDAALQNGRGGR